jgi:oxaloacetate decarboxylase alpha subunit
MAPREVKQVVKGMYGRTPVPISEEMIKLILGKGERVTVRPADLIEPELENARKEFAEYIEQEEDVLTGAMFPEPAKEFFKNRSEGRNKTE